MKSHQISAYAGNIQEICLRAHGKFKHYKSLEINEIEQEIPFRKIGEEVTGWILNKIPDMIIT